MGFFILNIYHMEDYLKQLPKLKNAAEYELAVTILGDYHEMGMIDFPEHLQIPERVKLWVLKSICREVEQNVKIENLFS